MKEQISCGKFIAIESTKVHYFHYFSYLILLGLDGTYNPSGVYSDKITDHHYQLNGGVNFRLDAITQGIVEKQYLNNPFQRFHQSIEDYPAFLDDIDDVSLRQYDDWERLKPYEAKEGTTVGQTHVLPMEDNDSKLYFYDA